MKEKVTKKLETNAAELIMISLFLVVFLSSCAQTYLPCAAYANNYSETEGQDEDKGYVTLNDLK